MSSGVGNFSAGALSGIVGANYSVLEEALTQCKLRKQELEQLLAEVTAEKLTPEVMNGAEVEQYETIVLDIQEKLKMVDENIQGFRKQIAKTEVCHKDNEANNCKTFAAYYLNGTQA